MKTPTIIDVTVTPEPNRPGLVGVRPFWSGVDQPAGVGWLCSEKIAPRLVRALRAGVVCTNPTVATSVHGHTYVECGYAVDRRHLNASLKRLGF